MLVRWGCKGARSVFAHPGDSEIDYRLLVTQSPECGADRSNMFVTELGEGVANQLKIVLSRLEVLVGHPRPLTVLDSGNTFGVRLLVGPVRAVSTSSGFQSSIQWARVALRSRTRGRCPASRSAVRPSLVSAMRAPYGWRISP